MADETRASLGTVQQTLFFPLLARARETVRKRPLLRDPKAVELVHAIDFDATTYRQGLVSSAVVLRTMIFDWWVRQFLVSFPGGMVVELGTGLNTRFERTDNGSVHWIDLDLPDTIELRRRFFADTSRRRMLAASLLDEDWLDEVARQPGPYFFVSDGVLVYLREPDVTAALQRIATRFPGATLAFDMYSSRAVAGEHRMAAKRQVARWDWACDDPSSLRPFGLEVIESATVSRPPARLRASLPARYRSLLPLAAPVIGGSALKLGLFRAVAGLPRSGLVAPVRTLASGDLAAPVPAPAAARRALARCTRRWRAGG
jgi:O-methyltransferase involved in polyketide biosynthesis